MNYSPGGRRRAVCQSQSFRWDEGYKLGRGWWCGTDAHPVLNASCHPQLDNLAIYWLP